MNYQDFEIEIRPLSGREYELIILRSSSGEARERATLPFDEAELQDHLANIEVAMMRSGKESPAEVLAEDKAVQRFGQLLFDFLFSGELLSTYRTSLNRARDNSAGLRVKLRLNDPQLAYLPWELLFDDLVSRQDYVCLSSETALVRYVEVQRPIEPLKVAPPLRILGMVVNPKNYPHQLDVAQEKQRIETAVQSLKENGRVELHWLEGNTKRDLQRAFRNGPWHVFHFIGHGAFDKVQDEGQLIFVDSEGNGDPFGAKDLARLLDGHQPLRLALLNACEGAKGGAALFSATAPILVGRGLPAVVAMQYTISDKNAIEFARTFYESLADGYSVDAAVTEARKAMSYEKTVEWAVPVLYMRAQDGVLFDVQGEIAQTEVDEITALFQLANQYYLNNQIPEALAVLQQILTIAQEIGDYNNAFTALKNLGQVHVDLGEMQLAIDALTDAYTMAQQFGLVEEALGLLATIGQLHVRQGEPSLAAEVFTTMGQVYLEFEEFQLAMEAFTEAYDVLQQVGLVAEMLEIAMISGQAALDFAEAQIALEEFEVAAELAEASENYPAINQAKYGIAQAQYLLACDYAEQQDWKTAVDIMKQATKSMKKIDHPEAADYAAELENWKWQLKHGY